MSGFSKADDDERVGGQARDALTIKYNVSIRAFLFLIVYKQTIRTLFVLVGVIPCLFFCRGEQVQEKQSLVEHVRLILT